MVTFPVLTALCHDWLSIVSKLQQLHKFWHGLLRHGKILYCDIGKWGYLIKSECRSIPDSDISPLESVYQ